VKMRMEIIPKGKGPAAAGARRVAEDNEEMLKRWGPAAAGPLRDVDGNCWGGCPPRHVG